MTTIEQKAEAYAIDCIGDYSPEFQQDFDDIKAHFIAGSNVADRGCPCLYLDEPCTPQCTCKNGFYSAGCMYCARYGSLEQRKQNAIRIAKAIAGSKATDSAGVWVKASERKPGFSNIIIWRFADHSGAYQGYSGKGFKFLNNTYLSSDDHISSIEWLDESKPPSPSLLQQENDRRIVELEEAFKRAAEIITNSYIPVHANDAHFIMRIIESCKK